jgi:hypothetical protein
LRDRVARPLTRDRADYRGGALETMSPALAEDPDTSPRSRPRLGRWVHTYWPLVALVLIAAVVAVLVRHLVFPAYSWNRDEPVYLWQMNMLREGKALVTDGGAPAFFYPWLAGHTGSSFFSQYTPGWPLVLAAFDIVFGSPGNALVFATVLAVVATYVFTRELLRDHALALIAAAVMTASPFLVIQSGTYLGYLFTYGLGLFFGAALLAGVRRQKPWLLVLAGLCVGWIFMTRPFDAVLWALAFGGYVVFAYWHHWARLARAAGWLAVGAAPPFVATLFFNHAVTGSFTQFPITAADPLDTFGLGQRRIMPQWPPFQYTLWQMVKGMGRNTVFLPIFLFGSYLSVAVVLVGLWLRRRDRTTVALLALALVFPLGYLTFWGLYLSATTANLSGPIYFMPVFATLSILIATVILAAWRRRRALGVLLVVVLLAATAPFLVNRLNINHKLSALQQPWQHVTDPIKHPALVFVARSGPYLMHLNPFSSNSPNLDGRIVYSTDHGPANLDLIDTHKGRTPYVEEWTTGNEDVAPVSSNAPVPRVKLVRLHVLDGNTMTFREDITTPATISGGVLVAYAKVGFQVLQQTLSTNAAPGQQYSTTWTVTTGPATDSQTLTYPADRLGAVEIGFGAGPTAATAIGPGHVAEVFGYRRVASSVEMMVPGVKYVFSIIEGGSVTTAIDDDGLLVHPTAVP